MKVLITGGAGGIGFLTGCVLASRGHDVILTVKNDKEVINTKKKIKELDLSVLVLKLDLTNDEDINQIKGYLLDVDVLYLHAGVGCIGLLNSIDINMFKEVFEVNLFSNLKLIQYFLNESDNKKVVMTSSLLAGKNIPFFSCYSMTKKCIDIMINILKRENIFNNNKFILIKPGAYHTGFNQYMVLSGEKNGINSDYLLFLDKMFLLLEEKNINSIVYKIVIAIEKGNGGIYSNPFFQQFLMTFIN